MSINASIGWLGTNVSLLCSFYSSYLQQKISDCRISALISHFSALRTLKKHGTLTTFSSIQHLKSTDFTIFSFAYASHTSESSQLCYFIGLVVGEVKKEVAFIFCHCLRTILVVLPNLHPMRNFSQRRRLSKRP